MASSIVFPVICFARGTSFLTEVLKSWDLDMLCRSCFFRSCVFDILPRFVISRINILRSHLLRLCGAGSNAAFICSGFLGSTFIGAEFGSAALMSRRSGFLPASFSSSKMEEGARSPSTGGCCGLGFFFRNSSVKGFAGAGVLTLDSLPFPSQRPNSHTLRR